MSRPGFRNLDRATLASSMIGSFNFFFSTKSDIRVFTMASLPYLFLKMPMVKTIKPANQSVGGLLQNTLSEVEIQSNEAHLSI
jgi:hypothetical protein